MVKIVMHAEPRWKRTRKSCPYCDNAYLKYNTRGDFYLCPACLNVLKESCE